MKIVVRFQMDGIYQELVDLCTLCKEQQASYMLSSLLSLKYNIICI